MVGLLVRVFGSAGEDACCRSLGYALFFPGIWRVGLHPLLKLLRRIALVCRDNVGRIHPVWEGLSALHCVPHMEACIREE